MMAAVNHWIHLISVVTLLGGIIFFPHLLIPVLKKNLPKETAETILFETYRKFLKISWILLILIVMSGGFNIYFVKHADPNRTLSPIWIQAFMLKLTFIIVLASTLLLNLMNIRPGPDGKGKLDEIPFQRTALLMGILILFLAAILRYSH
ncbi:MAG TPA: hypothetical protein VL126_16130 [Bacteroidota bacterium]|nr:hypothetical protein [Bacteroidota bacterium]